MSAAVVSRLDNSALLLVLQSWLAGIPSDQVLIRLMRLVDAIKPLLKRPDLLHQPLNIVRLFCEGSMLAAGDARPGFNGWLATQPDLPFRGLCSGRGRSDLVLLLDSSARGLLGPLGRRVSRHIVAVCHLGLLAGPAARTDPITADLSLPALLTSQCRTSPLLLSAKGFIMLVDQIPMNQTVCVAYLDDGLDLKARIVG